MTVLTHGVYNFGSDPHREITPVLGCEEVGFLKTDVLVCLVFNFRCCAFLILFVGYHGFMLKMLVQVINWKDSSEK